MKIQINLGTTLGISIDGSTEEIAALLATVFPGSAATVEVAPEPEAPDTPVETSPEAEFGPQRGEASQATYGAHPTLWVTKHRFQDRQGNFKKGTFELKYAGDIASKDLSSYAYFLGGEFSSDKEMKQCLDTVWRKARSMGYGFHTASVCRKAEESQ